MTKKTSISIPESNDQHRKISRSKAIKKVGMVTLAAGTMLTLLNTKKALAFSGAGSEQGGGTTLNDFTSGGNW